MSDHLGVGWAFPVGVNARGRIAMVRGERSVEQSILMILMTPKGQRVMRPDYGCQIHELLFAPNDATTMGLASFYVDEALRTWEPRIEVIHVSAHSDETHPERMILNIQYRLRDSHVEQSMVFPFYRMPTDVVTR